MDRAALSRHAGVRASIVALKPGNAGGAKGRRKVEDRLLTHQERTLPPSAARLNRVETLLRERGSTTCGVRTSPADASLAGEGKVTRGLIPRRWAEPEHGTNGSMRLSPLG